MGRLLIIIMLCAPATFAVNASAAAIKEGMTRGERLNHFVQSLYSFNKQRNSRLEVDIEESTGGYGGVTDNLEFYREVKHIDKKTGNLLANIKWETRNPDNLHTIDVYIYDAQGRIKREYSAAYLPVYRKAPYLTLINMHHYEKGLHSYRQFDFSDNRLFEFCAGNYLGEKIHLVLDEYEIPDSAAEFSDEIQRDVYTACFDAIPMSVAPYLAPGI